MMNSPKAPNATSGTPDGTSGTPSSMSPATPDGRTTAPLPGMGAKATPSTPEPKLPAQPMKSVPEGVAEQAKHAAESLLGQTKEKLETSLATRKDAVTDRASNVAGAIREAGEKLGGSGDMLPDYAGQAADQVERLTSYVRSRNIGQLIGDMEGFARKEPLIFLGGSFALGLIAARFLKSSANRDDGPATTASGPSKTSQPYSSLDTGGTRHGVHP